MRRGLAGVYIREPRRLPEWLRALYDDKLLAVVTSQGEEKTARHVLGEREKGLRYDSSGLHPRSM